MSELEDEVYDLTPIDQMDGADDFGDFQDPRYGNVSTGTRPSIHYVNESGLPDDVVNRHMRSKQGEIASIVEKWSQSLSQAPVQQTLDVFNRNKGLDDKLHIHAVMARVAWSVENDDILSTLADVIEGLMWQKCRFELIDSDQQSMWNQWAAEVNLDARLREMGREEFKLSQFYVGLLWEKRTYSVEEELIEEQLQEFDLEREKHKYEKQVQARDAYIASMKDTEGFVEPPEIPEPQERKQGRGNRRRKKKFPVVVPTEVTIFDPTKVIPVGTLMFGRERFAYIATREEHEAFMKVARGDARDDTVMRLLEGRYEPTPMDRDACAELGVAWEQLWLFRKDAIFRHSMTKADYERYAPVRLKPILPLLELKQHLRASDRASLIGNTNFIVVITKGTDKMPARPAEIANLQEQARVIARLPVLIGDHRLKVEIISPSMDKTLTESRWETLDSRLVFVALKTFSPVIQGGTGGGAGVSEMSRVVSKGLESRRHMLVRTLERHIFKKVLEKNEAHLDEMPSLAFAPKRITLDFSADIINSILKLRDRGDISRETTLEELDYDQDVEVLRRARERVRFDEVFESSTPHSSPTANPYAAQPGQLPPGGAQNVPGGNVGPNGQPRTEGGRPPGVTEEEPRNPSGRGEKRR